ncbi:major royal jelly family protein [Burkholderia cepacia]|uniref:major royal jelly family protein n=1 Tax=Burkholderia cepacia TaxID=292 RepID=UPI001FC8DC73|nr:major royal jelly family protein [Burkholderia cepacia]
MLHTLTKRRLALLAAVAMAGASSAVYATTASAATAHPAKLVAVRENSQMPWNAVAVDPRGRFIVSSPRWTGNTGPAVAIAEKNGTLKPYPDAGWNSWKPSSDPAHAFVSVNAIHEDAHGDLWIVDTGSPEFGGTPIPNGAKVVHIDPRTDTVIRVYTFPKEVIHAQTYVDDIRINGNHAYLTDAGEGALIVLNLDDGHVRRRFDGMSFVRARANDKIVVNGKVLTSSDGQPLKVNVDPLELSPDGRTLYFGPLSGPLSQIETRYLNDDTLSDDTLAEHVAMWFDNPPVGGTAMGVDGSLYYTPLADNSLMRRAPNGTVSLLARDKRLRWVDAPFLDGRGHIYLPVPQIDGAPAFNRGSSTVRFPVELYRVDLPAGLR